MAETEPTTNDMVNLLRFLGNETEWTYQPNYDESNAIQSFVQAKTTLSPQRVVATNEDLFYTSSSASSPFVAMMEQQRSNICCVSPSLEEMRDEDAVLSDDIIEYPPSNIISNNKVMFALDVAELMTSELIDYDRFENAVPEVPKSSGKKDIERINGNQHAERDTYSSNEDSSSSSRDTQTESQAKTKRSKKKNTKSSGKKSSHEAGPLRALSAYNFFFRDERDRILNNKEHDFSSEKEDLLLQGHWNRDRSEKRIHCKTHGKLSFTALSKEVSRRWKALPSPQRDFYRRVAQRDWKRYETELAAMSRQT